MEILIFVALIAVLSTVALLAINPMTQLKKSRDARRKNDLEKVQNKLESFFSDKGDYPTISCEDDECCQQLEKNDSLLSPYLDGIPADPVPDRKYLYCSQPEKSQWYKIYTNIEYPQDPQLARNPCQPGCVKNEKTYNYVVSSPNIPFATLAEDVLIRCGGGEWRQPSCDNPWNYCPPREPEDRGACCSGGFLYCQDELYWCCTTIQ